MASDRPQTQYSQTDMSRVTLTVEHKADMLTEVARAYLHTATPSCAIQALLKGVRRFKMETAVQADMDDALILKEIEEGLMALFGKLRLHETELYDKPAAPPSSPTPAPIAAVALSTPMSAPAAPLARPATPVGFEPAQYQKTTVRDVPKAKLSHHPDWEGQV
jgi:hypothetical protein